jgi:hypothetical protein
MFVASKQLFDEINHAIAVKTANKSLNACMGTHSIAEIYGRTSARFPRRFTVA